jgi:hypothetical protein
VVVADRRAESIVEVAEKVGGFGDVAVFEFTGDVIAE